MDGTRHRGIHTGHGFYAYTYSTRHGCDGWIIGWNGCNGWMDAMDGCMDGMDAMDGYMDG